jgi:2-oxoisovalerate dehydrogenase E2 component (dihydrolipoyl transacylase)
MSTTRTFAVPDLGEGLEEVTIVQWCVEPGDRVVLNQTLCVVETAKAEVEIPSPYDGCVTEFGGHDGDTLKVGSMLARFDVNAAVVTADTGTPSPAESSPARSSTVSNGVGATLVGYGPDPALDRSRRPLAAPAVRKLAIDQGVSLRDVSPGSGRNGIVTSGDVELASALAQSLSTHTAARPDARSETVRSTESSPASNANSVADASPAGANGSTTVIAVTGVRARIATHMALSRRTIADATCTLQVDATHLLELRDALNRSAETPVTAFALLCRIVVAALGDSPMLNASFHDEPEEIHVHRNIHLGIGTATGRGLVVAVIRDAHTRGLASLGNEIRRVTTAAKDATLAPAEMVGSTFTISNFGSLGLDDGIPIINAPQAAILGVGSIALRPWVVDGCVVARSTLSMTLAFDHRICDGREAARLLTDVRALVEQPERLLLAR